MENLPAHTNKLLTGYEKGLSIIQNLEGFTMKSICERWKELPQLSAIRKHDDRGLMKTVQIMLLELANTVKCSKVFDADKTETIARCIVADFWMLKLEDLHLALRRIATGQHKIFDRLDVPVIYECLNLYKQEKDDLWEALRDSKHMQDKASSGKEERGQITVREYWRKLNKENVKGE